jgi:hypothetical protein
MEEQEQIIVWEAPKIIPPEFKLYYDENGKVITYSCEKMEGNYIVIDAMTFAQARPDVRVIDGKLSTVAPSMVVSKLMPDDNEGTICSEYDISIIPSKPYKVKTKYWKLNTYELR